jgi:KDO2-lipid IV(A) lauroyltransferase
MLILGQVLLLLGACLVAPLGAGWLCVRWAPFRAMALPGSALAWLVGRVLRVRRAHVLESLARAGIMPAEATADAMYRGLGQGLFELLWVAAHPGRSLHGLVELDAEPIRRVLALGRGAVLATAHTGNWDLVGCAAAAEFPLTVATKRLSARWLDRIWQRVRIGRGVEIADAGRIAAVAASRLRAGGLVAMLVDQAPERRRGAVRSWFLGQLAAVDLAPALVALRARAPLVVVFPERGSGDVQRARVIEIIAPPDRASRAWAESAMQRVTALLDDHVRRRPGEWLWMHRRWKGPLPRAGQSRVGRAELADPAQLNGPAELLTDGGG